MRIILPQLTLEYTVKHDPDTVGVVDGEDLGLEPDLHAPGRAAVRLRGAALQVPRCGDPADVQLVILTPV